MSSCPECDRGLSPKATDCPCGWKLGKIKLDMPLGYQQCEWMAGSDRCRFPGSMSSNTGPGGPYFCRHHYRCDDASYGAQVVEASVDYRHPTPEEKSRAHALQAKENLKARGLDRQPNESPEAWQKRTLAWMRTQKVTKKMAA